jgi:glycosyltransferase involved in cell wall biosynthesis
VLSALSQTVEDIEVVVVDDGSEDSTKQVLEAIARRDSRVQFIRNNVSSGACSARNEAIAAARAEHVTGLDDDDFFLPDRVEALLSTYKPGLTLVGGQDLFIRPRGLVASHRPPEISIDQILMRNYFGNQGLFRKEDFLAVGGFDESLQSSQDYDLWIRLLMRGKCRMHTGLPTQVVYDIPKADRITTRSRADSASRLHLLAKYSHLMTSRQRAAHIAAVKTGERSWKAIPHRLRAQDFTVEGVIDLGRSIKRAIGK